jgi:hypothetical protein
VESREIRLALSHSVGKPQKDELIEGNYFRKGETMTYTKPEVAVLGEAVRVIEQRTAKTPHVVLDGMQPKLNPAYDLDE